MTSQLNASFTEELSDWLYSLSSISSFDPMSYALQKDVRNRNLVIGNKSQKFATRIAGLFYEW